MQHRGTLLPNVICLFIKDTIMARSLPNTETRFFFKFTALINPMYKKSHILYIDLSVKSD